MSYLSDVKEFNDKFKAHAVDPQSTADTEARISIGLLKLRLLREELEELNVAINTCNEVEIVDGMVDLAYVLFGMVYRLGYAEVFDHAWNEVHKSNMSKLGPDGKPIYREDGKILKGPNFFKPKIEVHYDANGKHFKIGNDVVTP